MTMTRDDRLSGEKKGGREVQGHLGEMGEEKKTLNLDERGGRNGYKGNRQSHNGLNQGRSKISNN